MLKELYNPSKFLQFLKNKYGRFVLIKSILYLSSGEKKELKINLEKNISLSTNKDKIRFNQFFTRLIN